MSDRRSALLVVDAQNDFCAGGALPVPHATRVLDRIAAYVGEAGRLGLPVYASRDWHPAASRHFAAQGGPWPAHCVQGTSGARFHASLPLPSTAIIVSKGVKPHEHGYSAFDGRTSDGVPLRGDLRARGITHLFVSGFATDYCVKHSVLDALSAGFAVTVLEDAVAGVDLRTGDAAQAMAEMRARGAVVAAGDGTLSA